MNTADVAQVSKSAAAASVGAPPFIFDRRSIETSIRPTETAMASRNNHAPQVWKPALQMAP